MAGTRSIVGATVEVRAPTQTEETSVELRFPLTPNIPQPKRHKEAEDDVVFGLFVLASSTSI